MSNAAATLRDHASVLWRGLLGLPRTVALIAWLWLRMRAPHRDAIARLRRAVRAPVPERDPLRACGPGLYEVAPHFLQQAALSPKALTVVHMLGTGENIYSPLAGLAALCDAEPRLRSARHVIVDTPHEAAGFLGPDEFATRMRRMLSPLLAQNRERIVLVGLSRGACAALDLAAELALQGTRVGVLAMSPPLSRPVRAPHTVINIGGFESVLENFVRQLALMPWQRPGGNALLRFLYLRFCGFVLAELRMASDAAITMTARFLSTCDPQQNCLRAVREFALLGRVSDAELRHVVSGAVERFSLTNDARVIVCWGSADAWVEIEPCQARLRQALKKHDVPPGRVQMHVLPGCNHGIGRELDQDFAPLAALLWQACEHAGETQPSMSDQSKAAGAHTGSTA